MSIYISTNLCEPGEMEYIFSVMDRINDKTVGIELFPEWQDRKFITELNKNIDRLKKYKSTLHGPYYDTEHSARRGTVEYNRAKEYFINTLEVSEKLNSEYIVYHYNNCKVEDECKTDMIDISVKNLAELNEMARIYEAEIVVENSGVQSLENVLLEQEEFINIALMSENRVLLDIGHAFANGWDLNHVISVLKDKIASYHIHNNDGVHDSHDRIENGKMNIEDFFDMYRKYTPCAHLVIEYGKQCREDADGIIEDVEKVRRELSMYDIIKPL